MGNRIGGPPTRIRAKGGHSKAIGAMGRHLSEATSWMLEKREAYLERGIEQVYERVRVTSR